MMETDSVPTIAPVPEEHELSRHWKAVQTAEGTIAQFDAWQALVTAAEQTGDLTHIRAALQGLVQAFPLCYGYWSRWAKHERNNNQPIAPPPGTEAAAQTPEQAAAEARRRAREVFEQSVTAAPHVHELWTGYATELLAGLAAGDIDVNSVRSALARGATVVASDASASPFWDKYLEFENSQYIASSASPPIGSHLAGVYAQLLSHPLRDIERFYASYVKFSAPASLSDLLTPTEAATAAATYPTEGGAEQWEAEQRKSVLSAREKSYTAARATRDERATFESRIARPYFHTAALDQTELNNWHEYLDFITNKQPLPHGAHQQAEAVKLFERCLIACASYPEYWERYVDYLEQQQLNEQLSAVITRALTTFMRENTSFHLIAAAVQERSGNTNRARELLLRVNTQLSPLSLQAWIARLNFERRQEDAENEGHVEATSAVYEEAIRVLQENKQTAENEQKEQKDNKQADAALLNVEFISLHYARFLAAYGVEAEQVRRVYERVADILAPPAGATAPAATEQAAEETKTNGDDTVTRGTTAAATGSTKVSASKHHAIFWLAWADYESRHPSTALSRVPAVFDRALSSNSGALSPASKHSLWTAYISFAEDRFISANEVIALQRRQQQFEKEHPALGLTKTAQTAGGAAAVGADKRKRKPLSDDNPFDQAKRGRGSAFASHTAPHAATSPHTAVSAATGGYGPTATAAGGYGAAGGYPTADPYAAYGGAGYGAATGYPPAAPYAAGYPPQHAAYPAGGYQQGYHY